jgi:hypothetical protein
MGGGVKEGEMGWQLRDKDAMDAALGRKKLALRLSISAATSFFLLSK